MRDFAGDHPRSRRIQVRQDILRRIRLRSICSVPCAAPKRRKLPDRSRSMRRRQSGPRRLVELARQQMTWPSLSVTTVTAGMSWRSRSERRAYADMFGPTTGDRVRLADTDLIIEVEKDFTTYGEEVKFGGGKVIRDGMGQSAGHQQAGRGRHRHHQRADPRPLGHREGRRRPQGRPHRRASARPAIPTSSRTSPSSSGPAPR